MTLRGISMMLSFFHGCKRCWSILGKVEDSFIILVVSISSQVVNILVNILYSIYQPNEENSRLKRVNKITFCCHSLSVKHDQQERQIHWSIPFASLISLSSCSLSSSNWLPNSNLIMSEKTGIKFILPVKYYYYCKILISFKIVYVLDKIFAIKCPILFKWTKDFRYIQVIYIK